MFVELGLDASLALRRWLLIHPAESSAAKPPSVEAIFKSEALDKQRISQREALFTLASWLREKLRRFPYWMQGHLEFAKTSLALDDIAAAYASTQALLVGKSSPELKAEAMFILAQCFLRRGEATKAVPLLEQLLSSGTKSPAAEQVKEELAAGYLALNQCEKVAEVLGSIPDTALTMPARSALQFARSRLKGDL